MANQWQRWKGIMKCYPFEEKRLSKWEPPYIVQPKYDGVRCKAIFLEHSQSYMLVSSEENVIHSVPHIYDALAATRLTAMLDGELYCHGMPFESIVSITSRTVNLHPDHRFIKFHVFDIVNDQPQMQRTLLIEALRGLHPSIEVSPFFLCENLEDIMRAYDNLIELGYEGIIVRHKMGPYEEKRSTWIMKFKPKKEDVYEIVGYTEEIDKDGTPKGALGALICRGSDGTRFQVGTGFTRAARESLWERAEVLSGKLARVSYQHITSGRKVPRFPVFVEVIDEGRNAESEMPS